MIYELYQMPSYKWVAFDSKTSEQPIHAIEAPSYIIIFAIIIVSSQQITYRNYISDWVSWLLKPKLWTLFSSAVCTVLLCHKRLDQLIRPSSQDCLLAHVLQASVDEWIVSWHLRELPEQSPTVTSVWPLEKRACGHYRKVRSHFCNQSNWQ